jgi:hypothetical protein
VYDTTAKTPEDVDLLHRLRISGGARLDELEGCFGHERVQQLVVDGLVALAGPERVSLTSEGRTAHEDALERELDRQGARAAVQGAYDRFVALNQDVLQVCTDWQLRDQGGAPVLNDHSDPDYDRDVLDRLDRLFDQASGVLDDLTGALDRFDVYRRDLRATKQRIGEGDVAYFTDPRVRSFHNVWFELHEDLLATLRIDRQGD